MIGSSFVIRCLMNYINEFLPEYFTRILHNPHKEIISNCTVVGTETTLQLIYLLLTLYSFLKLVLVIQQCQHLKIK